MIIGVQRNHHMSNTEKCYSNIIITKY